MGVELVVRSYRRRFAQPLHTAHGPWVWREGLLIRLTDGLGRVGYGEVAPIPWFGSESVTEALAFCQAQGEEWRSQPIPNGLPATQFGLESAAADLDTENSAGGQEPAIPADSFANAAICGLLPAGETAVEIASQRIAQGHRTLKWKIGVHPIADEIYWLNQLVQALPPDARLRLDANGGLNLAQAEQWLAACDRINASPQLATVEHLEQPLPPSQLTAMTALGERYQTAIALDESVATVAQLENCWQRGWRGVFVVKPAIAGSPQKLEAFCQQYQPRLVFSSAFETVIGRQAALAVAARCSPSPAPALGFGTQGWFADDWDTLTPAELWDRL
ncbi:MULTISPECIES: o-succinylbenzoate synthase [Cyanophyceae]|uniref:o-succinylbenzoate synthase n=1 Tax=Cyanophyceae TaxID=3028117 RepID=UPI001682EEFC|nr:MULTISPECIES: o-succinylbenzoate synthase [Cyanophyceae]MBD1919230.1 o-succinylbenzoate synthase [Phormidium sp. FACHB-77]MBD2030976.1 o-succinylbenzoate synthase [Phormidium sp. FACHB-322]MBD2054253.1 o-succinylbenzoate synthase [Leptolyngbya sp. FACHB-60]